MAASAALQPQPEQHRRGGVARAHAKHQNDNNIVASQVIPMTNPPSTLGDRFVALPAELRLHIFSFLLVQPVKWNMEHDATCPLLHNHNAYIVPTIPPYRAGRLCCSRCQDPWLMTWRDQVRDTTLGPVWVDPWRSKYAAEITNSYICSHCFDNDLRATLGGPAFPPLNHDMRCLCARRTNLDILFVSRQWREEAGSVLYAQNTFAFETPTLFADFAAGCGWRNKITKISILNATRCVPHEWNRFVRPDDEETSWDFYKKRLAMLRALRQFPQLSHVELDASLLNDRRHIRTMISLGLRNVQSIRFTYCTPLEQARAYFYEHDPRHIYHSFQDRYLLRGGLPGEVARAMMGERRRWLKQDAALKLAVLKQAVIYKQLEAKVVGMGQDTGIVDCGDSAIWQ